jgi:hypothetical protein
MTKVVPFFLIVLVVGFLLVPVVADALPKGAVGYKLYHQEGSEWVRYRQGDTFPSGGAVSPTNVWKYEYSVMNYQFANGVYYFMVFFNSDNLGLWAAYTSAVGPAANWVITYFPPISPNYNWKVRFRASLSQYYVALNDTLDGYSVQFTWAKAGTLPGSQNYDLISSSGSESGVTSELPPGTTPVETTTWGAVKELFSR